MEDVKDRIILEDQSLEAGFEEIFQTQWPRVYSVLVRLLGDPDEAEDISLEVFLRLHTHLGQAKQVDHLAGWLYRVASNLGLNALRSGKRRSLYESQAGTHAILEQQDLPTPHEQVEAEEMRRQVRLTLTKMNPRSAQLLTLRASGFTYQEIAETLGVSPASVGSLLCRAEAEFEKHFQ